MFVKKPLKSFEVDTALQYFDRGFQQCHGGGPLYYWTMFLKKTRNVLMLFWYILLLE